MLSQETKCYITDLLSRNHIIKCKLDNLHKQVKTLRQRIYVDSELCGLALHQNQKEVVSKDFIKQGGKHFAELSLVIAKIYDYQSEMQQNLYYIEGLRNGSIKEI